jgi:hypothetical protein
MQIGRRQRARVWVDHSQYHVLAGPEMNVGEESIPSLFLDLGPQAVAVLTGLYMGKVPVTAQALAATPGEPEDGWDVIGETDLDCPGGSIGVLDLNGSDYRQFGELASAGPGRYRMRVHIRDRRQAEEQKESREEHLLLFWPVTEPVPPALLTPMDEYGRIISGEDVVPAPPLDAVELAAGAAIRQLAEMVNAASPPALSGERVVVCARATVAGTRRQVWKIVSAPWIWIAMGGNSYPADFHTTLMDEPYLDALGAIVVDERPDRVAFTYSWTTLREVAADMPLLIAKSIDMATGRETDIVEMVPGTDIAESWLLPPKPTTVSISLRRAGKGVVAVELEHRDLPAELASLMQPFWDWALQRELPSRLADAQFYGYPWTR